MATTNFNVGTLDFDFSKLFAPLSKGTAYPTATGYKLSDGQDLNEVFAARNSVDAAVAKKTKFLLSDGVTDLADIFNGHNHVITYNIYVTKTSDTLYDYYTVTNTVGVATITITANGPTQCFFTAVAGGGGGSGRGGGGGGGMLVDSFFTENETLTIDVGKGGNVVKLSAQNSSSNGLNGDNTTVSFQKSSYPTITCYGGGGGGSGGGGAGKNGGSGGGGSYYAIGGSGVLGQGNSGGDGNLGGGGGGGGGGAGGAGGVGGALLGGGGVGGIGRYSNYSGTGLGYAGGGSGVIQNTLSVLEYGGGVASETNEDAAPSRGGGGGGKSGNFSSTNKAGIGGSGVFVLAVLRY